MKKWMVLLVIVLSVNIAYTKNYRVEKFQAHHVINHDNIVEVNEHIHFRFEKGSNNWVERSILFKNIDKIDVISAEIDYVEVPFGAGNNRAQVTDNAVKWTFNKIKQTDKNFGLYYRIKGAIYKDDDEDVLQYTLLPTKHSYEIDSVEVVIDYLKFTGSLTAHQIINGDALVSLDESNITIKNKRPLKKNETIELQLRFQKDKVITKNPKWSELKLKSKRLLITFTILGFLLLVISVIYSFLIYKNNNVSFKPNKKDLNRLESAPDELSPIEGAYLLNISFPDSQFLQYIGALMIKLLSKKSIKSIISRRKKGFAFDLLLQKDQSFDEYEKLIFDSLSTKKGLSLKQSLNIASLKVNNILKQIKTNLQEREIISLDLVKQRTKYTIIGSIIAAIGVLSILPFVLYFDIFTSSGLIIMFSLIISGIIIIIGAQSISPLTAQGVYLSQKIFYHKRHIEDLLEKEYNTDIHQYMLSQLPYIFAYKIQFEWYNKIKMHEFDVPEWFELADSCNNENPFHCFKIMISIILLYSSSSVTMKSLVKPISDLVEEDE